MVSNEQFEKAVGLINNAKNVLLTTHVRPDGDACGSIAAMCDILTSLGKKANPIFLSPLAGWYEFLFEQKPPILGNDITVEQLNAGYYDHCDLIIIVDTNSYIQLPQFDTWLKKTHTPVLVIDHHVTSDGIGTVELIDTTAAAAGQIVLDLFRHAKWPISSKIAEAFFVSLSTDTGWFRFSNTGSRGYRDAADLIEAGAEPAKIYRRMYQNFSLPRMKLLVTMLNSLDLHFDGRFAMQQLMWADFERTGSTGRDTENLIDECQRISSVEVAALFVEQKDSKFRCSLRSKGTVDVAKIASSFGGGGHKNAAGVTLPGTLKEAKKLIFDAVVKHFEQQGMTDSIQ
jgi:phosphoesterase RecJ-like protein